MLVAEDVARFRSGVDWWIGVIVLSVPAIALGTAVALQLSGDAAGALVGWAVLAGVVALYVAVVWPISYELHDDRLAVRFGLVRSTVPYRSIRSVRPSRSILASPALSLDRLALDTGSRLPVTISPADRPAFLAELSRRAPHLVPDERGLVSR